LSLTDDLLERIRAQNDIVSVVSSYISIKERGGRFFGLCPFHNEKTPSFCVNPRSQTFHCFGCGFGGDVFNFIMKYENLDFREAAAKLAQNAGISFDLSQSDRERSRLHDKKRRMLAINKTAAVYYYKSLRGNKGEAARAYLNKRGLTDDITKEFGLGFAPSDTERLISVLQEQGFIDKELIEAGICGFSELRGLYNRFVNRIIFPISDLNGRVIAFGGRVLGKGEPKYLNTADTPLFTKGANLYALNIARRVRSESLILCEGYLDVIALHKAGFTQAVAGLGTALTTAQASLIKRFASTVYLAYDSDSAGVKASIRNIEFLRNASVLVKVVDLSPYKDPDELINAKGAQEFESRLASACSSFIFEIRQLQKSYNLKDPEERIVFYRETAKRLGAMRHELERESYLKAISEEFLINAEQLRNMVREYALSYQPEKKSAGLAREGLLPNGSVMAAYPTKIGGSGVKRKSGDNASPPKAEFELLCLAIGNPAARTALRRYMTSADFSDEVYASIAACLLEDDNPSVLAIMNKYDAVEDKSKISAVFATVDAQKDGEGAYPFAYSEKRVRQLIHIIKERHISGQNIETVGTSRDLMDLLRRKRQSEQMLEHGSHT